MKKIKNQLMIFGISVLFLLFCLFYSYHHLLADRDVITDQKNFNQSFEQNVQSIFYLIPQEQIPTSTSLSLASTQVQTATTQIMQLRPSDTSIHYKKALLEIDNTIQTIQRQRLAVDRLSMNLQPILAAIQTSLAEIHLLIYQIVSTTFAYEDTQNLNKLIDSLNIAHQNLALIEILNSQDPVTSATLNSEAKLNLLRVIEMDKNSFNADTLDPRVKLQTIKVIRELEQKLNEQYYFQTDNIDVALLHQQLLKIEALKQDLLPINLVAQETGKISQQLLVILVIATFAACIRFSYLLALHFNPALPHSTLSQEERQKAIMELIKSKEQQLETITELREIRHNQTDTVITPVRNDDSTRIMHF